MLRRLQLASCLIAVTWAAAPLVATAQNAGLSDLVGARAGQAEGELQRRGYVNTGGTKADDRSYTNWWNASRQQCVTIAVMDGRYASITATPAPDCRQRATATPPRPSYDYGAQAARPRPGYEPDRGYSRPQPSYDGGPGYTPPMVDGRPVELGLVCFGDGSRDGIASGTTWTWNAQRDRYEYGRYNETRQEVFDASLMIQTWPGGGRIKLPRALIPPIHSRGADGWWDLYDVAVTPDTIRASYRLNGLNKPRIFIDRRSGRVTVEGLSNYGFRGTCDQMGHTPRRF